MRNPTLLLREKQSILTESEREIAKFVLKNPKEVCAMSIQVLATKSFSSASAVVRLCKSLGYNGFKEFKANLIAELAINNQHTIDSSIEIKRNEPLNEIVYKMTQNNIQSLKDTMNLLDLDVLSHCINLIYACNRVVLIGVGTSLITAKDAYSKFLRINKQMLFNEDWNLQLLCSRNATSRDVGLVISYSGETAEVLRCMKTLKENNTPIILITHNGKSNAMSLADYTLTTTANESLFRSGAIAVRISQFNLIDIIYTAVANKMYEQNQNEMENSST